jgi:hypothetical protein
MLSENNFGTSGEQNLSKAGFGLKLNTREKEATVRSWKWYLYLSQLLIVQV